MKLSTQDLKDMIPAWLGRDAVKEVQFNPNAWDDPEQYSQSAVDREASFYKLPAGMTLAAVEEHKFNLFKDGSQWKRSEKRRAADDVYEFGWFSAYHGEPLKMYPDHEEMFGVDMALANALHEAGTLKKCWLRTFIPASFLADNYRLEVVTDPDDTKVVAWQVITD